ncbi:MAG: S8 family serine peptidase, partial [Clostridia bacterium]|nr:S8 family serine peptidase [Clostridia bacterium]
DVDGEEGITPADARLILRAAVGLESLSGGDGPQTGSDFLFIPEESAVAFDEAETVLFYNNFINVYLLSALDAAEEQSLAALVGGTVAGRLTGSVELLQIQVPETSLAELKEKCETLMRNDAVLWATYDVPNEIAPMRADSDPWSGNPDEPESDRNNEASPGGRDWWAEAIHAYSAWDKTDELDTKIAVGVIDNGFYTEHPDLENRITFLEGYTENTPETHGTEVAGLIGANHNEIGMRGVCKDADLYCVDWALSEGRTLMTSGELFDATLKLIESGARVVNNSFGKRVYTKRGFEQAIKGNDEWWTDFYNEHHLNYKQYLAVKDSDAKKLAYQCIVLIGALVMREKTPDFLIVQSSGNGYYEFNENGEPIGVGRGLEAFKQGLYSAITEEVFNELNAVPAVGRRFEAAGVDFHTIADRILRVGAVQRASGDYSMAAFSNYGPDYVDICAPGTDVYTTTYDASNENPYTYAEVPGTSFAAPIVAGSAALVWGLNPALKAAEVKEILLSTANTSVRGVGDDRNSTYRMVNLDAAVDRVINQTYFDLWSHANELYCGLGLLPLEAGMLDEERKIIGEYTEYYPLSEKGAQAMRELPDYFSAPLIESITGSYTEMEDGLYWVGGGIGSDFWETRSVKLISKSGNNAVLGISGVGYDMETGSGWSDNVVTNPQNIVFEDGRWLFTGDHFDYDY